MLEGGTWHEAPLTEKNRRTQRERERTTVRFIETQIGVGREREGM